MNTSPNGGPGAGPGDNPNHGVGLVEACKAFINTAHQGPFLVNTGANDDRPLLVKLLSISSGGLLQSSLIKNPTMTGNRLMPINSKLWHTLR